MTSAASKDDEPAVLIWFVNEFAFAINESPPLEYISVCNDADCGVNDLVPALFI
jgi:hypothetical protein